MLLELIGEIFLSSEFIVKMALSIVWLSLPQVVEEISDWRRNK